MTIPGAGSVTGQVFNGNAAAAFGSDLFLFVSEDGTVSGWRAALGTTAETLVAGSDANVYKGAAFATIAGNSYLYAANFRAGQHRCRQGQCRGAGADRQLRRRHSAGRLRAVQRAEPGRFAVRQLRAARRREARRGRRGRPRASSTATTCRAICSAVSPAAARSTRRGGWRSRPPRSAPWPARCWSAISATGASTPMAADNSFLGQVLGRRRQAADDRRVVGPGARQRRCGRQHPAAVLHGRPGWRNPRPARRAGPGSRAVDLRDAAARAGGDRDFRPAASARCTLGASLIHADARRCASIDAVPFSDRPLRRIASDCIDSRCCGSCSRRRFLMRCRRRGVSRRGPTSARSIKGMSAPGHDEPAGSPAHHVFDHCPVCALHPLTAALPAAPLRLPGGERLHETPTLFLQAPSTLPAWRHALSRGPPSFS